MTEQTQPQTLLTHTKIAAAFKYPMGKPIMKALREGDGLILRREPTNQFDPNAIQVIGEGAEGETQLGYVPTTLAGTTLKNANLIRCWKDGRSWDAIVIEYVPAEMMS